MRISNWGGLSHATGLCLLLGCAGADGGLTPAPTDVVADRGPGQPSRGRPWRDPGVLADASTSSGETPTEPTPSDDAGAPSELSPSEPAPTEPAPTEPASSTGLDGLAPLPTELASTLRWPEAPRITREVTVRTASELAEAVRVSGTRVRVLGAVGGGISVPVDDIEILADDATSLGILNIGRGVARVRVVGGAWAGIHLAIPAQFSSGGAEHRAEWIVEDVLVEDVRVRSGDTAFALRGHRVAVLRSEVRAERYSVWSGDMGPFQSQDVILHENDFDSAGPEPTVRLVQVLRTATVANRITNTFKHNYRIHGTSDLAFAGRNLLVNTGVMLGRMPGDDLRRIWFDDNVLHHVSPDLFNPEGTIDALHATGNVAYTDVWSCLVCGGTPAGWTVRDNRVLPYIPAPPR
jgi:hypothetical protein